MAKCDEEGCLVMTTGKCINNLDLDNCPHYSSTDNVEDVTSAKIQEIEDFINENQPKGSVDVIDVYSGKALSLGEVNRISSASLTRLVILAGLPDAGKTTILLSLMHIFQTNISFEGYIFAGSETLMDFEEKSHPSKIDSEKNSGDTNRTPIGPPTFMHLKVAEKENVQVKTDLLFTDISGELFIALKDSTIEAQKFKLCERADHFALFFDADRITTLKERANAKASGLDILKSLHEAGTLLPHTNIQIVFSRWDLFSVKPEQQNHNEFMDLLKDDITKQFGNIYSITFFEVSARPKDGVLDFGFGIKEVFPIWVKKSILDQNELKFEARQRVSDRQFLKYQFNKE